MQKGLFLVCFFFFLHFGGFVFCCLCFVLVFCKKAPKGYFPAILEVFCLFCSHKRPVLKCFFSSYFVFLLLSSLSKIHFLFAFYPSTPFYRRLFVGFLSFSFCLPFPFLRFACLSDTNFPNIPFLKSNLLSFLAVSFFFLLFLFLFSLCMFQPFCFLLLCWLCFWCFLCFVFLFASCGVLSFCICCFVLNFVFFVFHSSQKKDPPKNRTQQKPQKQKCRKTGQQKKTVSAVVFTNSVLQFFGVGLKFWCFGWKEYIYIYLSLFYIIYYIYAVKFLSGPSLGFLEVIIWSKSGFWKPLSGPSLCF